MKATDHRATLYYDIKVYWASEGYGVIQAFHAEPGMWTILYESELRDRADSINEIHAADSAVIEHSGLNPYRVRYELYDAENSVMRTWP